MTNLTRYSLLIVGAGFLALGLLAYFRVLDDLSKNSGIAMIILGAVSVVYYFVRRKQ